MLVPSRAATSSPASEDVPSVYTPYCGLYSAYYMLRSHGYDVSFTDLLTAENISSPEGSSVAEVQQMLERRGMNTLVVEHLDEHSLFRSDASAVLLVASNESHGKYNHFVVFQPHTGSEAFIVDPPADPEGIALGDLGNRWTGTAVFASSHPMNLGSFRVQHNTEIAAWCVALIAAALVLRFANRLDTRFVKVFCNRRILQFGLLVFAHGIIAIVLVVLAGYDRIVAATRAPAPHTSSIPITRAVDRAELLAKLKQGVLLVDARLPEDFADGHIPQSINIPVYTSSAQLRKRMSAYSLDTPIVVYCKSRRCTFDADLAQRLVTIGFRDVGVFVGGWEEWLQLQPKAGS